MKVGDSLRIEPSFGLSKSGIVCPFGFLIETHTACSSL